MTAARYFSRRLRPLLLAGAIPPWLSKHPRFPYIRACILSCPEWADLAAIDALREEARRLMRKTGIPHVLDHIIPLNHPYVCGLSVPENLQILTAAQNQAEGNKWAPDQMQLL